VRLVIFYIFITIPIFAQKFNISFIAYIDNSWKIVVCDDNFKCTTKSTLQEPRTYDYNFNDNSLIYIGSDKNLRFVKDNNETVLIKVDKNAYTQPSFIDNNNIILVELINRNSKKTRIIKLNLSSKKITFLHTQNATSLDPYLNKDKLYYANVSCVEGCGKIIQEIWNKDLITNISNQLTLKNSISYQPVATLDNKFIYFSSMDRDGYHIWRYSNKLKDIKQITFGDVIDQFPAIYKGNIMFIREIKDSYKLLYYKDGKLIKIPLPKKYQKIRNLKVSK